MMEEKLMINVLEDTKKLYHDAWYYHLRRMGFSRNQAKKEIKEMM